MNKYPAKKNKYEPPLSLNIYDSIFEIIDILRYEIVHGWMDIQMNKHSAKTEDMKPNYH